MNRSTVLLTTLAISPVLAQDFVQQRKSETVWETIGNAINSLSADSHADYTASTRHVVERRDGRSYEVAVRRWSESNGKFGSGYLIKDRNEVVHRVESRGGESRYGSNYNGWRVKDPMPPRNPPTGTPPKSPPPANQVSGSLWNGWRVGYVGYAREFVDDLFGFGFYAFQPTADACVPSPFYDYANLPPYIDGSRVNPASDRPDPNEVATVSVARDGTKTTTITSYSLGGKSTTIVVQTPDGRKVFSYLRNDGTVAHTIGHILSGPTPTYVQPLPPQQGDLDVKKALADLVQVWEKYDDKAIDRLVPRSGFVQVHVADQSYKLSANDFFDLFHDGVDNTKTLSFGLISHSENGNEVEVEARHDFHDPWNQMRQVLQKYILVKEPAGYMIRNFESEPYTQG